MTNAEKAQSMMALAEVYAKPENQEIESPLMSIYVSDKKELLGVIRAIGGRFTKKIDSYSGDYMRFESMRIPGVQVSIPRDRVCRKVVTWDCEPLLSDEEIAEVEIVGAEQ